VKRTLIILLGLAILAGGCSLNSSKPALVLTWQRTTSSSCGGCCGPCGITEKEVQAALASLRPDLGAMGIKVRLDEKMPSAVAKKTNGTQMWIGGVPLETWLGAQNVPSSMSCCAGEAKGSGGCQSLSMAGQTYSVIPADLIVRAGMMAGEQLRSSGKIDPTAIKSLKGCAGCPGGGACGKIVR
jgi:hypothetical protein